MEALKLKYEKNLQELEHNIPMLQQIIVKPFEKDNELSQLKKDISTLEREITIKIRENQIKQVNSSENSIEIKETPMIMMEVNKPGIEKAYCQRKNLAHGKQRGWGYSRYVCDQVYTYF